MFNDTLFYQLKKEVNVNDYETFKETKLAIFDL